jgi:hypothetical protein
MTAGTPRARLWLRMIRSMGLAFAIACVLLIVFALFFADRMIFLPQPADAYWEATRKPDFEEIELAAGDGTKTVSWHLRRPGSRCTVLFLHGNAGNLSHRADTARALAKLGADVFLVGYHGYGRSAGRPGEDAVYDDADMAWRYLTERCGVAPARIVVFGESLGGAPAIELATKRACGAVILQSAFSSIPAMARCVMPYFPGHWFVKSKMDNLAKIPSVAAPKLFIATKRDEVVPCAQTRSLFDAAPEPKQWVEFDDCGHNDLFWAKNSEWSKAIGEFLDRTFPSESR